MPLGFANNIFTASSTTAGADWSAWDGSSDVTQDTVSFSGDVEHFLSFEWFDETYNESLYFHNRGINVTLKPQSDPTASKIVEGYTDEMLKRLREIGSG